MPPTGSSNHIDNLEHHSGLRAKKVLAFVDDGSGNAVLPVSNTLAVRYLVDSVTATTFYLGKASPGTATSSATWQIAKIDESSGTVVTWCDGDTEFNNIWDNRESLSYS